MTDTSDALKEYLPGDAFDRGRVNRAAFFHWCRALFGREQPRHFTQLAHAYEDRVRHVANVRRARRREERLRLDKLMKPVQQVVLTKEGEEIFSDSDCEDDFDEFIQVIVAEEAEEEGEFTCDGCERDIDMHYSSRYRCLSCEDLDSCPTCHALFSSLERDGFSMRSGNRRLRAHATTHEMQCIKGGSSGRTLFQTGILSRGVSMCRCRCRIS